VQVLLPADPRPVEHAADVSGARARGALEIWLQLVAATGMTNGEAIARKARDPRMEIDTPSLGRLRFDQTGDLAADAFQTSSARAGDWIVDRKP
jgi:hypothetical protein